MGTDSAQENRIFLKTVLPKLWKNLNCPSFLGAKIIRVPLIKYLSLSLCWMVLAEYWQILTLDLHFMLTSTHFQWLSPKYYTMWKDYIITYLYWSHSKPKDRGWASWLDNGLRDTLVFWLTSEDSLSSLIKPWERQGGMARSGVCVFVVILLEMEMKRKKEMCPGWLM